MYFRNSSKEVGNNSEERRKSVKRWKMAAGRAKLRQGYSMLYLD